MLATIVSRIRTFISRGIVGDIKKDRTALGYTLILSQKTAVDTFENLWDAEFKLYSQWGEDGIVWFLCEALKIDKPRMLEIGAGNFTECNSRFLAEFRNAALYLVDARSDLRESVESSDLNWKNHIFTQEIWVTPSNASDICEMARKTLGRLDILSLDVDGLDYWILSEMNLIDIKFLVLEYNPIFGSEAKVTVPKSDYFDRSKAHSSWLYFGVSLNAWVSEMKSRGFEFVGTNRAGNNAFFVAANLLNYLPDKITHNEDLSKFIDWQVRESRGENGELTYLSQREAMGLIAEFELHQI